MTRTLTTLVAACAVAVAVAVAMLCHGSAMAQLDEPNCPFESETCPSAPQIVLENVHSTSYSVRADVVNQDANAQIEEVAVAYQSADLPDGVVKIVANVRVTSIGPNGDLTIIIDIYAIGASGDQVYIESLVKVVKAVRLTGGDQ